MKELNKFKFLNEYNPSKGGQILTEQLIPASLEGLKFAMEQDKELYTFLNTPAKDLPSHFKYLVDEISPDIENESLFTIIKVSLWRQKSSGISSFFSKSGNKLTGFVGYSVINNEVTDIKMFSFNPQPGSAAVLIRDLMGLLDELIIKYNKVSWFAIKGNPANRIYQKAIEKYNGIVKDEDGDYRYTILKK